MIIATLFVCSFSVLQSFPVLVFCRFCLGILSAFYLALACNLIKDHYPDHMWKPLGALFSAARIIGILICYIMGQLFSTLTTATGNIVLFFGPLIIAAVQSIVLGYQLPESPVELLQAKQP